MIAIWTSAWRVSGVQSTTRYQESQGLLAVVVVRTFTSGSVDLWASLFTDHRCVILFFVCLIFAIGLDCEIILTVKFSRSTVIIHKESSAYCMNLRKFLVELFLITLSGLLVSSGKSALLQIIKQTYLTHYTLSFIFYKSFWGYWYLVQAVSPLLLWASTGNFS